MSDGMTDRRSQPDSEHPLLTPEMVDKFQEEFKRRAIQTMVAGNPFQNFTVAEIRTMADGFSHEAWCALRKVSKE